jgi:hypothetical protein
MKSTQAMRDRIRELSTISDDYDRAVLCVLDDFDCFHQALEDIVATIPATQGGTQGAIRKCAVSALSLL